MNKFGHGTKSSSIRQCDFIVASLRFFLLFLVSLLPALILHDSLAVGCDFSFISSVTSVNHSTLLRIVDFFASATYIFYNFFSSTVVNGQAIISGTRSGVGGGGVSSIECWDSQLFLSEPGPICS